MGGDRGGYNRNNYGGGNQGYNNFNRRGGDGGGYRGSQGGRQVEIIIRFLYQLYIQKF